MKSNATMIGWIKRNESQSLEHIGGLSNTSQLPCPSYSIPAQSCGVGSKLRKVKGSTCAKCYARKGTYCYSNVQAALERNLATMGTLARWTRAQTRIHKALSERYGLDVFRWHDSGDLQGVQHLRALVIIARAVPAIRYWIPTREYATVRRYLATYGALPDNLTVRLSAPMVDGPVVQIANLPTSTVETSDVYGPDSFTCPAGLQQGTCGDCRACWSQDVVNISYPVNT